MVKWSSGDSENWPKTENKQTKSFPGKIKILKKQQKTRVQRENQRENWEESNVKS